MADAIVAPHVGAWIEIFDLVDYESSVFVAPHVGAWIEIRKLIKTLSESTLSLLM